MAGETGQGESALAELLPQELAFARGVPSERDVCRWMEDAARADADILVFDCGNAVPTDAQNAVIARLVSEGRLVIASGDHADEPAYPAWSADAFAVGAVEDDGTLTHETPYFPDAGKPDIYAPRTITGTACERLVDRPEMDGTTFAALYVAVAAMLVWATDRDLTAQDVRALLVETATPIPAARGDTAKQLDVEAALDSARRKVIVGALGSDALELGQLLAETPIRPELAVPLLDDLVADGDRIRRVVRNGIEQYERADTVVGPRNE
ncbi:S8/S53 family peptidase [Rhodococcus opacus]|uniref:S8/S53 family peptidase n=1 Tax=Rhodococcus opacus TaxID=37919 RepID=UPI0009C0D431|nr:S8/S53 family peptidase [Rhodococcus opacus]